jgi:dolichol kinase
MNLTKEEITRKVLHLFSGLLIPGSILLIPVLAKDYMPAVSGVKPWMYASVALGLLSVLMAGIEIIRMKSDLVQGLFKKAFGSMMRKEESTRLTGATYMIIAGFICSVVFRSRPDISFMTLSSFIWGDAVAALVGIEFGRTRIGSKSLEGSAACFITCILMYFVLFPFVPMVCDKWGGFAPLTIILAGSLCTTILELFPIHIGKRLILNDNLTVPVLTGIVMLVFSGQI